MEVKQRTTANVAPKLGEATAPKKGFKEKKETFLHFLYNKEMGKVLGRTGMQWARVALFYVIFFSCLFGLLTGMILLTQEYFTYPDKPNYYGAGTIIGQTPALLVVTPDAYHVSGRKSSIISFKDEDEKSWQKYVDDMRVNLKDYEDRKENQVDCAFEKERKRKAAEADKYSCIVDLKNNDAMDGFGGCACETTVSECKFGFDTGEPCIAVGFMKVIAWIPSVAKSAKDCWLDRVTLNCSSPDNSSIVRFEVYPKNGLRTCYFPYPAKVNHWRRPIFMIKLLSVGNDETHTLTCKASGALQPLKIEFKITKRMNVTPSVF